MLNPIFDSSISAPSHSEKTGFDSHQPYLHMARHPIGIKYFLVRIKTNTNINKPGELITIKYKFW